MIPPPASLVAAIGGNFDRRWTASAPAEGIVKHDIPAIYCEFTRGLQLRDVDIQWAEGIPAYSTGALGCEHSQGLILDGVSELGRPPFGRALELLDTQVERIERIHLRQ
ncbi:MAG: hypothetical protein ABI770_07325 [Sphingomicrobium sp.]